jgi:hypothetical protein
LAANINGTIPIFVTDDSSNTEARYRARFYFDPNAVVMANNDNFTRFYGYQGTSTASMQIQLRRAASITLTLEKLLLGDVQGAALNMPTIRSAVVTVRNIG